MKQAAEGGEIGQCKDFLYDDVHWTISYMVADTRKQHSFGLVRRPKPVYAGG